MTQTTNNATLEVRPLEERTFSEVMQICEDTLIQMVHYQAENESPVLINSCQKHADYCYRVLGKMCKDKNNAEAQAFVAMVEENYKIANAVLANAAATKEERDAARSMKQSALFYVETLGLDISMGEGEKSAPAQKGE